MQDAVLQTTENNTDLPVDNGYHLVKDIYGLLPLGRLVCLCTGHAFIIIIMFIFREMASALKSNVRKTRF